MLSVKPTLPVAETSDFSARALLWPMQRRGPPFVAASPSPAAVGLCAQPRVTSAPADGRTSSAGDVAACAGLRGRRGASPPQPPAPRRTGDVLSSPRCVRRVQRSRRVSHGRPQSSFSGGNLLWLPRVSRAEGASRQDPLPRLWAQQPPSPCFSSQASHADYLPDSPHSPRQDVALIAPSCR